MPLIGTGKHKFPEDVVLRVIKEEFEKFSALYPRRSLKEIKLVRYDPGGRRKVFLMQATSGKFFLSLVNIWTYLEISFYHFIHGDKVSITTKMLLVHVLTKKYICLHIMMS